MDLHPWRTGRRYQPSPQSSTSRATTSTIGRVRRSNHFRESSDSVACLDGVGTRASSGESGRDSTLGSVGSKVLDLALRALCGKQSQELFEFLGVSLVFRPCCLFWSRSARGAGPSGAATRRPEGGIALGARSSYRAGWVRTRLPSGGEPPQISLFVRLGYFLSGEMDAGGVDSGARGGDLTR